MDPRRACRGHNSTTVNASAAQKQKAWPETQDMAAMQYVPLHVRRPPVLRRIQRPGPRQIFVTGSCHHLIEGRERYALCRFPDMILGATLARCLLADEFAFNPFAKVAVELALKETRGLPGAKSLSVWGSRGTRPARCRCPTRSRRSRRAPGGASGRAVSGGLERRKLPRLESLAAMLAEE